MFDYLYELIHGESKFAAEMRKHDQSLKESERKVDEQLKAELQHAQYMQELEREHLKPNKTIEGIDDEHREIIKARAILIEEAQSFIANANKTLKELGLTGHFKSYKKNDFYYRIGYIGGHVHAGDAHKCLRCSISSNDEIKTLKDFFVPIENYDKHLVWMRPIMEMGLQEIIEFYEFLPDFYAECLKSLENNADNK